MDAVSKQALLDDIANANDPELHLRLANSILVDALLSYPQPVDLNWLRNEYDHVSISVFCNTLYRLESSGSLDSCGVLTTVITDRGIAHLTHIVATSMLASSGEDVGDLSDHLFREIPPAEIFSKGVNSDG